jgi:hypothetical protein
MPCWTVTLYEPSDGSGNRGDKPYRHYWVCTTREGASHCLGTKIRETIAERYDPECSGYLGDEILDDLKKCSSWNKEARVLQERVAELPLQIEPATVKELDRVAAASTPNTYDSSDADRWKKHRLWLETKLKAYTDAFDGWIKERDQEILDCVVEHLIKENGDFEFSDEKRIKVRESSSWEDVNFAPNKKTKRNE